ncbi:MAG: GTP 3',8-cyclase MoaA [Bacteroidota bacterium]
MVDNHNRTVNYLRLAVTDRCNLRCFYCMPEEGIDYVPRQNLLTYEELLRLIRIMAELGVSKVRITGGEPFLRKGLMGFLRELVAIPGIQKVPITTNGTLLRKYLDELLELGINSFNLSLDSLDKDRFFRITRRDAFEEVMACLELMLDRGVEVKINAVVMAGKNIEDILPMVALTEGRNLSVRFIEEMPFNGGGQGASSIEWNYHKILDHISDRYPSLIKLQDPQFSTSMNFQVEGFQGSFGIIPAYSRSFCGTCNRIRLTPKGTIKTCLYDHGVFNLRDLLRAGATDQQLADAVEAAVANRSVDGFAAEALNKSRGLAFESMSSIGG